MNCKHISRRNVLRGLCQGTAVGLGLPMLDLFLNDNGNALASGGPLPTCFGTWFWGLGFTPGIWVPEKIGLDYQLPPHLEALRPVQDKINLYSGMRVFIDGQNETHRTGAQGVMTGQTLQPFASYSRSIDHFIAEGINARARFSSLTVACSNNPEESWTARGDSGRTPAEVSPLVLYQRLFGQGFQDPNADTFTPDPDVMLRHSLLSYLGDERQTLMQQVGTNDKARLDEFFTSLRDLELKLSLELQKPEPMPSCTIPSATPAEGNSSPRLADTLATHELMAQLIAHALSCGQTRIFNITFAGNNSIVPGDPNTYHTYTHEERIDPELGYAPKSHWFVSQYLKGIMDFVSIMDGIKEGDGTLLDRMLVLMYTDVGDARLHTTEDLPLITAGRAGGAMKTGRHVSAPGETTSRVGLTCFHALGVRNESWGEGANRATQPLAEVLA